MDVRFLERDEIIVELEVIGVKVSSTSRESTDSLRKTLKERAYPERYVFSPELAEPHEAARRQPLQEVITCQKKYQAVQRFLLQSIYAGTSEDEIFSRVHHKLVHIRGRMARASKYDVFRERMGQLSVIGDFLMNMMYRLLVGQASPYEVADKLSRVVIKIDTPISEIGQVVIDYTEYEDDEEEAKEESAVEQIVSLNGEEVEVIEVEQLEEKQVEGVNDLEEEEDDEEEAVEAQVVSIDGGTATDDEPGEEQAVSPADEVNEVKEQEAEEQLEAEGSFEKLEEEPDENEVEEANDKEEEEKSEEVQFVLLGEETEASEGGTGDPEEECPVVSAKAPIQNTGNPSSKAQDSRKRCQRDASANIRSKRARRARITTQSCAWVERYAAHVQTPVHRLLDVLDLRLEDEVLAKANRRVFREYVSVFFC